MNISTHNNYVVLKTTNPKSVLQQIISFIIIAIGIFLNLHIILFI